MLLEAAGDGVFSEQQEGNIVLVDLKSGTNRTLVAGKDVQDVISDSVASDFHLICLSTGTSAPHLLVWVESFSEHGVYLVPNR
jgi:hypothetical protein